MAGAVRERKPHTTPIRNARSRTRLGAMKISFGFVAGPESGHFAKKSSSTATLGCEVLYIT
jgi:hypothetical protein